MALTGSSMNEIMAWGFRAIIGIATLVGLPIAGWMLNRTVATIDKVSDGVATHTLQLEHVQTTVTDQLGYLKSIVGDHETRLRSLERTQPSIRP